MNRLLIVYKRSNLDSYRRRTHQGRRSQNSMEKVLHNAHVDHERCLGVLTRAATTLGLHTTHCLREDLAGVDESQFDFVVTAGGDGTLLSTAPFLATLPVLALNTAPRSSVGFFAAAFEPTILTWLSAIVAGAVKPHLLTRMRVQLNGVQVGHDVLNDALFAHALPVMTTRMSIKPPGVRRAEEQKCSGIWVSTPAGSTSAARAAGGRILPLGSNQLGFVVREPYVSWQGAYTHTRGLIAAGRELVIESRLAAGQLFTDGSTHETALRFGDELRFRTSPHPLKLFGYSPAMISIHKVRNKDFERFCARTVVSRPLTKKGKRS